MTLAVALQKRLGAFTLDVDFTAGSGVTIVFGESGSGKTTLLRCVAGIARPEAGRIALGDRVLLDTRRGVDVVPARRRIGFVFQQLALFPHLTAAGNIGYGIAHLSAAERHDRILAVAGSFRIDHVLDRRPAGLSGGERQRVGLARSLVTDPEILLLDEPLSALDYATQSRIIDDLRRWNDTRHIPILYVTHSQREVFALGNRVLLLEAGRIVSEGRPNDVMDMPAHDRVAELMGFENLLQAVVIGRRPDSGVMAVRLDGTAIDLETPLVTAEVGEPVRVAIRAGDILVATERPRGVSARNLLPATIAALHRRGALVTLAARLASNHPVDIEVHVTPAACAELELQPGRTIWLLIKTHSCHPVRAL